MDSRSWERLAAQFSELEQLPATERAGVLAGLDPEAARELGELLRVHEEAEPLAVAQLSQSVLRRGERQGLGPGDQLGPYTLVSLIGRGGMGEVWLAERDEGGFRRQVAIKRVREGLGGPRLAARFQLERQLLARLGHRSIARLLDSGEDADGNLFLVLEWVDGLPITEACTSAGLDVAARLALFEEVCRTVAFAHANLVVHRDLKPSNILVTAQGEVRLLDFGIAKLLATEPGGPALTLPDQPVLTLEYASPEQLTGAGVSTATDVWALGVVLFELLVGSRPFARLEGSRAALVTAIVETDAPAPSSIAATRPLVRQLRGDLDTIVATALRRDPLARYGSVEQLADDIGRFRAGWPIRARPESLAYRTRKFVSRHRLGTALAAAALVATLVAGVVVVRERDRARSERDNAREVSRLLVSLFEADPWSASEAPRTTTTLGAFLESSEVAVRARSAADPTLRAQLLLLLGKLYANLGEPAAAVSLAAEVVEVRRAATGRGPELADALDVLGTAQQEAGRYDEAEATFREALALRERGDDQKSLADALTNMATLLHTRERVADLPEAARLQARALTIRRELFGTEHLDTAQALANLAVVQLAQGDVAAESGLREALAIRERLLGADHPLVATTCNNLANLLLERGDWDEAEVLFRRAIASWSTALGANHPRVSTGWWGLSHTLEGRGDLDGALAAARQSHSIDSARLPAEHPYLADGLGRIVMLEAKLGAGFGAGQAES